MSDYEIPLDVAKVKDLHKRRKETRDVEEMRSIADEFFEYIRPLHFRQKEVAEYIFSHGEYVPWNQRNKKPISQTKTQ